MADTKLERELLSIGYARKTYRVTLLEGEWPPEGEIITFADDGALGGRPHHFGGHITDTGERMKTVAVYVD